ncbi:MAG TPA: tetratricopeptide repeat protein [Stellaceae bacterium]|jgi:Flp pilus assembly protein TadD|nr:tetratricopeptide repeat protein [Stellaceae bacterium]
MNRQLILASTILATVAIVSAAARADSTREYEPSKPAAPAAPAAMTLAAAQQKVDASDYRGAIPILTAVVQKDPNNADALNLMGYSLRKTGQTDLAMQYYNKALALMPNHLGANEYLGELYVEQGQMDKAKQRLVVLQAACGNCAQAQDLNKAITTGVPNTKKSW